MTKLPGWAAAGLLLLVFSSSPGAAVAADPPVRARSGANLASLFSDRDYPRDAVRNREQGPVAFRLTVGSDGRPTDCAVRVSSGSALLDSTTCRLLMERARFQPARDGDGKAVADAIDGRIVWRLPNDAAMVRVEAAMNLWSACLLGEAAKLALSDLSVEELVRRSYPPCAALEARISSEAGKPYQRNQSEIVEAFEATIVRARASLQAPRPSQP